MIEETTKARIAGFLDGDGCIGIYKVKKRRGASWQYVLNVVFGQSRGDKMKILRDIMGVYGGKIYKIPRKTPEHNAWALRMTGLAAYSLLIDVVQFLRVREKQAKLAIEFLEYRRTNNGIFEGGRLAQEHTDYYESCKQKMHWYNR